jgi:hypothetical protein
VADVTDGASIPEPEKTGVEPTQQQAGADLVLVPPPSEKAYGLMSEMLAAHYLGSGITAAAIPLLQIYEQKSEERFRQVDDERLDALRRLDQSVAENNRNVVLVERYRERLAGGYSGRIAEQIMTTIGAATLGAGIADLLSMQRPVGYLLAIIGALLLLCGWGLAIWAIIRNKEKM